MSSQCLSNLKMPTQWLKEKKSKGREEGKEGRRKREKKGEREEDLWEKDLRALEVIYFFLV